MLLGELRLGAAPDFPVSRQDDPSFDGDAEAGQVVVVLGQTVVDVHNQPGDVTSRGIGVEGWQLVGVAGILVLADGGLFQVQAVVTPRGSLQPARGWVKEQWLAKCAS